MLVIEGPTVIDPLPAHQQLFAAPASSCEFQVSEPLPGLVPVAVNLVSPPELEFS